MTSQLGLATRILHEAEDPEPVFGALAPSIVTSTNFKSTPDSSAFSAIDLKEDSPFFYARWSSPTVRTLELKLAALEGGEDCLCYATGMAAVTALILGRFKTGDHLIFSDVSYAGVAELARDLLPGLGFEISSVDFSDLNAVKAALRPNTKLIWAETPCNPILRLTDIQGLATIARNAGVELAVDSTIATPLATNPLQLGAHWVVHSLTKYLNGHGDALGGALIGSREALTRLRIAAPILLGGTLSPFNAWLIIRGLHTLPLRMRQHQENALQVAGFLEQHKAVARVLYPGLASHPQHALARRQMRNFSGMLSFQVKGDPERAARAFAADSKVFTYAVSLGKQKSLIYYLGTNDMCRSSFSLAGAQLESYRAYAGDGVFRVSVGLEDAPDLCADLGRVLDSLT